MRPSDPRLAHAESIALNRLIAIARDSESDHEARLAAVAIFTIRRLGDDAAAGVASTARPADQQPEPHPAAPPRTPPNTRPPDSPLTPDELAQLARLLPHVKPQRFLKKHSPAHWRAVLHRHAPTIAATGPPLPSHRAA